MSKRPKINLTYGDLNVIADTIWKTQNQQLHYTKKSRMDIYNKIKTLFGETPVRITEKETKDE
jgi:hypothetical protein|tara:strand:+ start:12224 stop:12412 length:189 start_codon:yes stop_codon:yes gene_type:complete